MHEPEGADRWPRMAPQVRLSDNPVIPVCSVQVYGLVSKLITNRGEQVKTGVVTISGQRDGQLGP